MEQYDALDRRTATRYMPATGGPVTQVALTNPAGHTTTETIDPAWQLPVQTADANGHTVDATYDGLGRLTNVWLPGRNAASETPNLQFSYLLRNNAPTAVTTDALTATGTYRTQIILYDAMLRQRQSQSDAPGGGRVITDTYHGSRGLVEWASKPYYDASGDPPATTLVGPAEQAEIPGVTEYVYDGVGRSTDQIFEKNGVEQWRTSTSYGGDRTHVTPPAGGTATTSITDARGNTIGLRQYHGPSPTGSYDQTTCGA